jgi:hypothetical protein
LERQEFGLDVFQRMMAELDLAVAWTGVQGAAARRPYRMTVVSHAGTEAFSRLPLELLRDVEGDVFARPGSSIVRTFVGNATRAFAMPEAPRVLFAWAHAKANDFDPQPHVDALRAVYGDAMAVLGNATLAALASQLREAATAGRPFPIVQVLAHGTGGDEIVLADGVWPAKLVAKAIRGRGVALVFLCSCQSGMGFAGVGQQILAADGGDVPCVVACQADLPVRGSAALAERFHRLLRRTRDPALAQARARREAYDAGDAWSVPVLLARTPVPPAPDKPPALFGLPIASATWQSRPVLEDDAFAKLQRGRLVSILGLPGIGKTEVGNAVARRALASGLCAQATYFVVQPESTPDRVLSLLAASLGRPELRAVEEIGALLDAGGSRLLVLDNAEDLMRDPLTHPKCQDLVHGLLRNTKNLRLLLSTRWATLCDGEAVVEVGPMSIDETAALLRAEFAACRPPSGNRSAPPAPPPRSSACAPAARLARGRRRAPRDRRARALRRLRQTVPLGAPLRVDTERSALRVRPRVRLLRRREPRRAPRRRSVPAGNEPGGLVDCIRNRPATSFKEAAEPPPWKRRPRLPRRHLQDQAPDRRSRGTRVVRRAGAVRGGACAERPGRAAAAGAVAAGQDRASCRDHVAVARVDGCPAR